MPERSLRPSKLVPLLFASICISGIAALIYFAHAAALQSVPAYSTMNTNPDGAKLLFDGLKGAHFIEVSRQFKSISRERPYSAAVFFLGVDRAGLAYEDEAYLNEMENAASRGNELVIALLNEEFDPFPFVSQHKPSLLEQRWGIRFVQNKGKEASNVTFDKNWHEVGEGVQQRNYGKGNITIVQDGQRLSNKAVASDESNRELLRLLVGNYRSAVFEEAHLGIVETGSVAGLARHFHLQGLILGLILLAGLFVWSRSVSFPPPPPAAEKVLLGADTRSMLTELMSRHLKDQLISTCVSEWNRTRAHASPLSLPEESNAVAAYAQLQERFEKRSKSTTL